MAKKREEENTGRGRERLSRQSRKEILLARKQEQQMRQVRLGVYVVVGLLLIVLIVALINEFFIVPNRAVAVVNGEEIALSDWNDRVTYERAQRITFLENQFVAFDENVGIIQQFAGQTINDLIDPEGLGQATLNQMVDEAAIRQAAEERGISVSDAEVDEFVGASFNYFNGESPTPRPTGVATIMPTPSLTPIPTAVITEVVPTNTPFPTATLGPTSTPRPTATPVSEETYQEELGTFVTSLTDLGADESVYREVIRMQLLREKLADALAEEQGLPREKEQASVFVITANSEEDAQELQAMIAADGFLTVWNTLRSGEAEISATATETLWRIQEDYGSSLGEEGSDLAFSLPVGEPSDMIVREIDAETQSFTFIQVSGREVRDLTDQQFDTDKFEALSSFIDTQLTGNLELTNVADGRAPTVPIIDQKFLQPPTPVPQSPETQTLPEDGN
ncbi:MAG: SurA N-terminal domain-containing protein [Chloroflexota bacterium]